MDLSTVFSAFRGLTHRSTDTFASLHDGFDMPHRRALTPDVPQLVARADADKPFTPAHRAHGGLHSRADPPAPAPDQWANWLGEEVCTPLSKTEPRDLPELVALITAAGARQQRVRAVGAGHSMSDVARTDGAVLVGTERLAVVTDVDRARLNARGAALRLMRVGAGIRLATLNTILDSLGVALPHMGAYDGQSLAGAFATGTHGSGAHWPPMAGMIRAVVLVAANGTVFQIEPSPAGGAITDPAKFPGHLPEEPGVPVTLVQNDDWFNAAQVAMGCLGVVYTYTLEVTEAFNVAENRTATRWEAVKDIFAPDKWNPLPAPLAQFDHFEMTISPYASDDGTHSLIWTERQRVAQTPVRGTRQDCAGKILEKVGILFSKTLMDILSLFPNLVPSSINTALDDLVDDDAPYINKSFTVFKALDSELELKAHGLELHFPAENLVATIDKIMAAYKTLADQKKMYIAGPIGIRFTAPSTALLAPESGRLTATAELTNLILSEPGAQLLRDVMAAVTKEDRSIRVHWGLELDTTTAQDMRDWYGTNLDKFLAVFHELNANGMFNNKFTERVGLQ